MSSSKRSRAAAPEGKDDGSAGTTCNLPGCTKPKYKDTRVTGGRQHDYCGRTHAREAGACKIEPHGPCRTLCKLEGCEYQCYFDADTERVHDFCSRTCHALALKRGEWSKAGKSVRPEKGGKGGGKRRKGDSGGLGGARQCGLPGCNRAVFSDPYTTRVFDYCNLTHAQKAKDRGLQRPEGCEVMARCYSCGVSEEALSSDRACAVCRDGVVVCDGCRVRHAFV